MLFDLPGQVELFNMHDALRQVVAAITGPEWNLRLCTVHLIDSHLCADPAKYIAALMLSLSSMLHLETPHVNVLSKVDLMDKYGELDFNLEYYADVMNLEYLADRILDGNTGCNRHCTVAGADDDAKEVREADQGPVRAGGGLWAG